jgi:DNA-binding IclR family transcriptional regulator
LRIVACVSWGFLTNQGRALLCIAADPGVRLREIAARLDITERAAFGVVKDLVSAGYIVKERDGRRNRYHVRTEAPLPDVFLRQRTVGHLLALLDDPGRETARRVRAR